MSDLNPKTIRLALKIVETLDNGYYHIHAHVVTVPPSGETVGYIDSYDTVGKLWMQGLTVKSQGNQSDTDKRLYGFDVVYRNMYEVDTREAGRIAHTLQTIQKRMDRLSDKFGRPTTFGQFMGRVANAIGAKFIVFESQRSNPGLQFLEVSLGIDKIDRIVADWVATGLTSAANAQRRKDAQVAS